VTYFLEQEQDIVLSTPKIYERLAEKYTLHEHGSRKRKKRGPKPEATAPREVVQMDTVDFGRVLAFTAVDVLTPDVKPRVERILP
jgi:hypothetical protein